MIKCTHCGKLGTIDSIKNKHMVVVVTEFGYELYCNNPECCHDITIVETDETDRK